MTQPRLDSIEQAIAEIAAGRAVVIVDDEQRENEGDLVFAASRATPELLAFTIRHSSGVVCVPMEGTALDRLGVPLMTTQNRDRMQTAYTVSVDASSGVSTGICAADRSRTIRTLADPTSEPADIVQPGHVFPLRYREDGVLARPGHTEAAVDLVRLAGLPAAGVICELVNDDGSMKRGAQLRAFADDHGLALVAIADLVRFLRRAESQVERVARARIPTEHGVFQAHGYRDLVDGTEQLALVCGDIGSGEDVLVRLHSECLTGDVLGSRRCDCGLQLRASLAAIGAEGRGVVVYLRGHEGRGIGLLHKLQAYTLQDAGRDTVDANLELGLPADARDYATGGQMLRDLGVTSVRLLTNNPTKVAALVEQGIHVGERLAVAVDPHDDNREYLITKRDRMGHDLAHPALGQPAAAVLPGQASIA